MDASKKTQLEPCDIETVRQIAAGIWRLCQVYEQGFMMQVVMREFMNQAIPSSALGESDEHREGYLSVIKENLAGRKLDAEELKALITETADEALFPFGHKEGIS